MSAGNVANDLAGAILRHDFLRYPSPGLPRGGWCKEWLHFCVLTSDVDLIVNLNVSGDVRPAVVAGSRVARIVALARANSWHGDVETIDSRGVAVFPGDVKMVLGQNFAEFRDGRFELVVGLQSQPWVAELRFEPLTVPLAVSREVPVGRGSLGWFALPRLAATGRIVVGSEVFTLRAAPAYHDHNWGRWLWGDNFCWEWGFAHFNSGGSTWSVLFDRTLNRARTHVIESTLALWCDTDLVRVFSRNEITVLPLIYDTPGALVRVPRPLALAVPQLGRDVPRKFQVSSVSGSDRLSFLLTTEHEAQVLIPNETDLETTIITEVTGALSLEGRVGGQPVAGSGRALFEFLTI